MGQFQYLVDGFTGFILHDLKITVYIGLGSAALTILAVVPPWPFYNKNPQSWLPAGTELEAENKGDRAISDLRRYVAILATVITSLDCPRASGLFHLIAFDGPYSFVPRIRGRGPETVAGSIG
ncbi:hypothetical protein K440DRAFT_657501 [Wilcoxina mikolae CBS 423.85]|nr:hypothetical protein K440DRAFT_657501 [Wilcoxina mikolae CBS 423.85]